LIVVVGAMVLVVIVERTDYISIQRLKKRRRLKSKSG